MATKIVGFRKWAEFASEVQDKPVLIVKKGKGKYETYFEGQYDGPKDAILEAYYWGEKIPVDHLA